MNDKPDLAPPPDRLSLSRWSRRKLEAARAKSGPAREVAPAAPGQQAPHPAPPSAPEATAALPPIESLSIESDFAPFFKPDIPESAKRAALKQLFRDPRFNVMDRLDVYIDDYTQPDPIPPEMMKQLLHTRHIFNPPKTQVNAEGHVVDVVEQVEPEETPGIAATAISDGTVDANPESLPGEIDASAEPDTVRQAEPQGGTKA